MRLVAPFSSRIARRACLAALAALLGDALYRALDGSVAHAEDAATFRVLVHPENPARSVSREALAKIFLKEVTEWDGGEPSHPVDLRGD